MRTENILETVARLKNRGCEFLDKIPDTYYDNVRKNIAAMSVGMSVCDPVQNQTASYFSRVIVTSKEPTRVFYMSKETYINIYVEEINK